MGLDILPNSKVPPHSQPPIVASSSSATYTSPRKHLAQNKQQGCASGLPPAAPGFTQESTQVVSELRGESGCSPGEVPVLQQQGAGELPDMLDQFLQSFERHVNSCAREEGGKDGESSTEPSKSNAVPNKCKGTKTRATTAKDRLQNTHAPGPVINRQRAAVQQSNKAQSKRSKTVAASASLDHSSSKNPEGKKKRKSQRRRKGQYLFSLERKRVRTQSSASDRTAQIHFDREDKQLQKMPVVKLERGGPLPVRVRLQEHSCLEVKVPNFPSFSLSYTQTIQPSDNWCL